MVRFQAVSLLRGVAVFVLATLCGCCGTTDEAARSAARRVRGDGSYRKRTCYRCHGADRCGTEMGPPLTNLGEHWNVDTLTAYIEDPAPFRERDARLRDLVGLYHGRLMKGFSVREGERRALAEWLLDAPAQGECP